jgi:hypothetical protein
MFRRFSPLRAQLVGKTDVRGHVFPYSLLRTSQTLPHRRDPQLTIYYLKIENIAVRDF